MINRHDPYGRFLPPRHHRLLLTLTAIALLLGLLGGTLLTLGSTAAAAPLPSRPGETAAPLTPPAQITAQQAITARDIVVVFDVSGSMEYGTTCYDCWVRTDSNNPDFPNNGYFNPLPYNTAWNGDEPSQSSIPLSDLCVQPSTAHVNSGNRYLVHEAELYSRNVGDWSLAARTPGQGFWVLQRGTQNPNNINNPYENGAYKGNQAGNEAVQSSNVCNPSIQGNGINCSPRTDGINPDNVCSSADGGLAADCSAYIKAHPYLTYSNGWNGKLLGAAYDLSCFTTGTCWNSVGIDDPSRPSPNLVPYVEYDFTPDWSGTTTIWIRARGGASNYSRAWNGLYAASTMPYYNYVLWQVDSGAVQQNNLVSDAGSFGQDNRIVPGNWQWIKLGSVSGTSGVQQLLRIYQGSAGYKIDKIVFTNASDSNASSYLSSANSGKGPGATNGSATREACNVCNPEFGLTVDAPDCSCKLNSSDAARGGYGGGEGCTTVLTVTNQLEVDLYRGPEPLRSAQETVKHFARQLDPQVHQLGLVAFSTNVENGTTGYERRSPLQCLREATISGDPRECYDPTFTTDPISFTNVLEAVERQWSDGGTDIAEGLREGLVELGVAPYATDSNCDGTAYSACDRGDAAHKTLVLITDGAPNQNPGSCAPTGGRPDLWNGDVSPNDDAFECAVYFAKEAADNDVVVFTIGLGPGAEPDLLTAIAEGRDPHSTSGAGDEFLFDTCGGQFFSASAPTDLEAIMEQIAANSINGCRQGVNQVTVSGPTTGLTGVAQTFTATIDPLVATQPISYVWQAVEQTTVTHPNGGTTDTVPFTWNTPGQKTITVIAENALGSATDSHTITLTVETIPATGLTLSGPTSGDTATGYSFTATVSPVNATQPFTYVWQATDKAPVTHPGGVGSDSITFSWTTPGSKTVTVTADNGAGPVNDSHTIVISAPGAPETVIYLPLILKS